MDARARVAYFCMEYGLHESLRTYAGGLGILAGDHLKSAKDVGAPLVAIGLMWHKGYTTQWVGTDGRPFDTFPPQDMCMLKDTGAMVSIDLCGTRTACRIWLVDAYGNVPLYLLDTDIPGNENAWVTQQLYGGGPEERVAQEIVLGVGGVRLLRELGIYPDIYHFNEGHAVFAGLELIREGMAKGLSFEEAWADLRTKVVFTTHTPVAAGNESHDLAQLMRWGADCGLSERQLASIGGDPFSMTVAGLRLSGLANGVSLLHAQTAEAMWHGVEDRAPILAITNGVHQETWQNPKIRALPAEALWDAHQAAKRRLLEFVAVRSGVKLREDALLVGVARRAAPYKRHDLIFRYPELLEPSLDSGQLQILLAGRAHPSDAMGKDVIARLVSFAQRYPKSVVFMENYDIEVGKLLTGGCDVWLNTPIRPLEASGTSGMKAAMNGVLNVSILDGWWDEACEDGVNGWQIGSREEAPDDERDHHALYQVLLDKVVPAYYGERTAWTEMMAASIRMAQERFSAKRMLEEYYGMLYEPLATARRT